MKHALSASMMSLVVAVVVSDSAIARVSTVTVKIPEIKTAAEKEVDVLIEVSRCRGLGGIQFVLSFDPQVVELLEVQTGSMTSRGSSNVRNREPGKARIAMIADGVIVGDGQLLVARFKAIGNSRQSTTLEIEEAKGVTFKDRVEMLVTVEPGRQEISAKEADPAAADNNLLLWIAIGVGAVII